MKLSETPIRERTFEFEDVIWDSSADTSTQRVSSGSETSSWSRITSRISQALMPYGAAATLAAFEPAAGRSRYSARTVSRSQVRAVAWMVDDFVYTQGEITKKEIEALNRLFMLDAPEGFRLDLPDI